MEIEVNARFLAYDYGVTATCATELAAQPAQNVLSPHRLEMMKTDASTATHELQINLGTSDRRIRGVGVISNLRPDETLTIETYSSTAFLPAQLIQTHTSTVRQVITDNEWHHTELTAGYLKHEYNTTSQKLFTYTGFDSVARGVIIKFILSAARAIEVSGVICGDYLETDTNVAAIYTPSIEPRSSLVYGAEGDPLATQGGMIKRIRIDWPMLTYHERQRLMLISGVLGMQQRALLSVTPTLGDYNEVLDSIFGRIDESIEVPHREEDQNYFSGSMSIIEPYIP